MMLMLQLQNKISSICNEIKSVKVDVLLDTQTPDNTRSGKVVEKILVLFFCKLFNQTI